MKKTLTFMLCAGLLFGGCSRYNFLEKQKILEELDSERKFSYAKYKPYEIRENVKRDTRTGKWISAGYDLDRNGKIDLGANFNVMMETFDEDGVIYTIRDNAVFVLVNSDEDDIIDVSYSDTGGNDEILETKKIENISIQSSIQDSQ